jgi:hypothetical protein
MSANLEDDLQTSTSGDTPYRYSIFASDRFVATPAEALASLATAAPADADLGLARFERALRLALPGHRAGRGTWAAPAEALPRGLRLTLPADAAEDAGLEIEALARRHGLVIFDEELEEISFPTHLGRRDHLRAAADALFAAGDGYLLVEGGPEDRYFVQAIGSVDDGRIVAEAVSNRYLPAELKRPKTTLARLRALGWSPPRGAQGNYHRTYALAANAAPPDLADVIAGTLSTVYGMSERTPVTICLTLG